MQEAREIGLTKNQIIASEESALSVSLEARAVAEVQAAYVIAKKFPRNRHQARMKILDACKSQIFAEKAMYTYPIAGKLISLPGIRLAEVAARSWGNIDFGIRQLSQGALSSTVEAYAIDLETNVPARVVFEVQHVRDTKKGQQKLTTQRDIYEMVANQGARRLRSCILKLIDTDIIEEAVLQIRKTLESGEVPLSEQINKMISAFDEYGIKVEHLEKRLGHKLEATIPQEIASLKGLYRSLKDGYATREELFDIAIKTSDAEATLQNILKEKKLKNEEKEKQVNEKQE